MPVAFVFITCNPIEYNVPAIDNARNPRPLTFSRSPATMLKPIKIARIRAMPDAIIKRLIPLEIIDGAYANERTLISIYIKPEREKYNDEDRYNTHMKKYKMGCERMAKLAQACGLNSVTDLDDCAGKFVKVTLTSREYNGKNYLDMKSAEKYGIAKPVLVSPKQEPKPEPATETTTEEEVKNDILF